MRDISPSKTEQRVLDAIDEAALVTAVSDLVTVRSVSGEETPAQEKVAELMAESGLDVDLWQINFAQLAKHPAYCAEIERREGLGVVGTFGDGRGPSLLLNGHVDVVPAGDEDNWSLPAWQGVRQDSRIYGRGSADMKGGLCCAIFAARALRDANIELDGRLRIASVIGEEDGGVGTLATLERGYRADGAVIMEPTELTVVPAQAGAMNFRLTVHGRSAHACMREEGESAIEHFFPIHQALLAHEAEKNAAENNPLFARYRLPYPLSIGNLRAGDWPSSVPEELICEGRYGVALSESLEQARQRFEEVVQQAAQGSTWLHRHVPRVEWWGGQFAPAATAVDDPIVTTLSRSAETILGQAPRVEGVTYGADMRLLVLEGGIPTVLFGPGDVRRAHAPDEFVPIAELLAATRSLALTALRFCGVGGQADHQVQPLESNSPFF